MSNPRVRYTVRIPRPETHRILVEMSVAEAEEGGVRLRMPVWTPGSYLVREYSRHVSRVTARRVSGDEVPVEKVDKNTWVAHSKPGKRVIVSYEVYANELTVRTSHVDSDHAFIHSAGVFLYVEGRESERMTVTLEPPEGWSVATALPLVAENTWSAESLDQLVDSPFEIGTHQVLSFEVNGTPHRIALYGDGNYDRERLLGDTHEICKTATEMFGGEHPSEAYLFIFHVLEGAGGGLEHRDSNVCGFKPHDFRPERAWVRRLGLISHEYFHTWNVKRIRPRELGPFDYTQENYTRLLWMAEGFTTYFDNLIVRRAGLSSIPVYLDEVAQDIRFFMEVPGRAVDTVADASFDAWIKLYRPHENSRNSTVSYYLKGSLVAWLLDLTIRDATDGERRLDDVMRSLWGLYRNRPETGYDEAELRSALEDAAGRSLSTEIDAWVHGTGELPFGELLGKFGLELVPRGGDEADPAPWLGAVTAEENGRTMVKSVLTGTPAFEGGLNAGDELIALNGWRLGPVPDRLADLEPGEEVEFLVSRRGRVRAIAFPLGEAPCVDRVLKPRADAGERERRLFEGWLGGELDEAAEDPGPAPKDPRPHPI